MVNFAYRIESELDAPILSKWAELGFEAETYTAYDGNLLLPLWQYGQKPYSSVGGGFSFEDGTRPQIFEWEQAKFRISVPTEDMPDSGWPVAIYSHGTGGNYSTYANGDSNLEPCEDTSTRQASWELVYRSLFTPTEELEQTRRSTLSIFLNPTSARAMFRQYALDQIFPIKGHVCAQSYL